MERLTKYRRIIAQVLQAQIQDYQTGTVEDTLVQSEDSNRFLVICTGWFKDENFHGMTQDVELRKDGKVIIHADNTEDDLAEDLIAAGIPAAAIIKAYDPDQARHLNQVQPEKQAPSRRQNRSRKPVEAETQRMAA